MKLLRIGDLEIEQHDDLSNKTEQIGFIGGVGEIVMKRRQETGVKLTRRCFILILCIEVSIVTLSKDNSQRVMKGWLKWCHC